MDVQTVVAYIAILSSVGGWIYTYFHSQHSDEERLAALELRFAEYGVKVDTLWDFLFRRGASEAVQRGLGVMNSPIVINDGAKAWFDGMRNELQAWYLLHTDLTDSDLMIAIEQNFGDRILREVCIPNGIYQGACLLIATAVAKGGDTPVTLADDVVVDSKDQVCQPTTLPKS
jgi:hypothetical protein